MSDVTRLPQTHPYRAPQPRSREYGRLRIGLREGMTIKLTTAQSPQLWQLFVRVRRGPATWITEPGVKREGEGRGELKEKSTVMKPMSRP